MNHKHAIIPHSIVNSGMNEMLLATDRWMATLAHELRDPLTLVVMSLDLLESFCASDAGARLQRNVAREGAWHMVRVIEDVLELSRHRRGKLESPKVVDLIEIIDGAIKCTSHLMKFKNHTLTTSLPSHRVSLYANSTQLQQVLMNLLTNAAKYTDPGGHIRLTAECCITTVVLRIADNGKGIATDKLPFVFEPFWQATETLSTSMGGLGLGLSLVKMLVELNGGSIDAQSEGIGTGAEFTIRLPISSAITSAATQHNHAGKSDLISARSST